MTSPADIERAVSFLPARMRERLRNIDLKVWWIGETDRFWYRRDLSEGHEYIRGDAGAGIVEPAFDHRKMAKLLTEKADIACSATTLPIDYLEYAGSELRVTVGALTWAIGADLSTCRQVIEDRIQAGEVSSPNGRFAAYQRDYDLWARDTKTQKIWNLSGDGTDGLAYAKSPDGNLCTVSSKLREITLPAAVVWSPDSRYLVTHVLDERNVRPVHLVHGAPETGGRQLLHTIRVAFPGDEHIPTLRHVVIDIETGAKVWAVLPPQIAHQGSSIERGHVWWSGNGKTVFIIAFDRGDKSVSLFAVDAVTGESRLVIEENSETFIDLRHGPLVTRPNVRVVDETGELIWFSQRDGWGHLYLYDLATGELKNRITNGPWIVRSIHRVDAVNRLIYFLASGNDTHVDPYFRKLYRIGFDGEGLECLTPDDVDHQISESDPVPPREFKPGKANMRPEGVSPTGSYFVVVGSTPQKPPATSIIRSDGTEVMMLERLDVQPALAMGWRPPESFNVKAADGITDIYGAIWLPPNFDPNESYPVVDYIFGGPQTIQTPKRCFSSDEINRVCIAAAFAELGFVVVTIDARGTPYRSKQFHDFIYGSLQSKGGMEDHVSALRQLADTRSYIDLNRSAAFGHSAGATSALMGLLMHPDVFKAAAGSSGGYDLSGFVFYWGEKYIGLMTRDADGRSNFDDQFVGRLAGEMQGDLLLGFGDLDDNVSPALTTKLIQCLNAHEKVFELVLVPDANHADMECDSNWLRTCMRFFTRTLGPRATAQDTQISSHVAK